MKNNNYKLIKVIKDKNAGTKRKMISILLLLGFIVSVVTFTTFSNNSSQQNKQQDSSQNAVAAQHALAARAQDAIAAVDNDEIKFTADGTPYIICISSLQFFLLMSQVNATLLKNFI